MTRSLRWYTIKLYYHYSFLATSNLVGPGRAVLMRSDACSGGSGCGNAATSSPLLFSKLNL